jgi:hypothetical protein
MCKKMGDLNTNEFLTEEEQQKNPVNKILKNLKLKILRKDVRLKQLF